MDIAMYSNDNGYLKFTGVQKWDSVEQMKEHYSVTSEGRSEKLVGHLDAQIILHENFGYAVRDQSLAALKRPGTWVYVGADNGDYGDNDEYIYMPSCEELE